MDKNDGYLNSNTVNFPYQNFLVSALYSCIKNLLLTLILLLLCYFLNAEQGPSWSWLYGSWIYNYLCNQCLSPLKLWVRIPLRWGVLDTTLYDKVWQWLMAGRWFSPGTPVSSTNKTDRHGITEILLKQSGVKHHNHNPNLLD